MGVHQPETCRQMNWYVTRNVAHQQSERGQCPRFNNNSFIIHLSTAPGRTQYVGGPIVNSGGKADVLSDDHLKLKVSFGMHKFDHDS